MLDDPGHPDLPTDPARHACAIAADAVHRAAGAASQGFALPGAQGIAAECGAGRKRRQRREAAAVAVHALLGEPLAPMQLLACCLEAESAVAGRHLDNLAPSLLGGVVTILGTDPPDVSPVPVRTAPWFAMAHPHLQVRTADARAVLPESVSRATMIAQLASVSALVTALAAGDFALLGRALVDRRGARPSTASTGVRARTRGRARGRRGGWIILWQRPHHVRGMCNASGGHGGGNRHARRVHGDRCGVRYARRHDRHGGCAMAAGQGARRARAERLMSSDHAGATA